MGRFGDEYILTDNRLGRNLLWAPSSRVSESNAFLLSRVLVGAHHVHWDELSPWHSLSEQATGLIAGVIGKTEICLGHKESYISFLLYYQAPHKK